ncbi:MAG: ABC-2 transporter permease [Ruminococcus sp.]
MKGLLLKDFYNLRKNGIFLLVTLICFGFVGALGGVGASFVIMWGLISSMQIVSTFTFDEAVKWNSFGMTMPVIRKELVGAKFIVQCCLTIFGVGVTLLVTLLTSACMQKLTGAMLQEILLLSWLGFWAIIFLGGLSVLLLFQFAAEHARVIASLVFAVPVGASFALMNYFSPASTQTSEAGFSAVMYVVLLAGIPAVVLVWEFVMYRISCRVFAKKDLA